MAIDTKITQEDIYLYEILRNPALFTEFMYNYDLTEFDEPIELTWYQKEFVSDFSHYVSIVAGRSAGKTFSLVGLLCWVLVFKVYPNPYSVYLTPNKSQMEPVWTGLVSSFRTNSFLKQFIQPNSGINASDFRITLNNGSVLMCRIAGTAGTGQNVVGLHVDFFVVDESGYQPWGTWLELQPTINTFTNGYRLLVAGVPDGRREDSVCYYADQVSSVYSKHRVSSDMNPRLTDKDRQRAVEQFGGEESEDFLHLWHARHGTPVFSIFSRENMAFESYPVFKLHLNGQTMSDDISEYINRLSILPAVPNKAAQTVIGIDLGYTEPTAIVILYSDNYGRLKFHARIQLDKVSYTLQERIIDFLDSKFEPVVLGMDKGSAGISTYQHLIADKDYINKNYEKRLIPVDFSGSVIVGIDSEGEDVKSKTKPFAVSVLQDYANNHKIIFSHTDLELVTELERMSYTKNPNGDISYKTLTVKGGKRGEDHFTASLLCGVLAYYLATDFMIFRPEKKILARPRWF